jgi:hypothetical protein
MDERGTVPVQVDGVRDWPSSVAEELLRVLRSNSNSDVAVNSPPNFPPLLR